MSTPAPYRVDEWVRMRKDGNVTGTVKNLYYSVVTDTWVVYVLWESGFAWLHGMADLDAIEGVAMEEVSA